MTYQQLINSTKDTCIVLQNKFAITSGTTAKTLITNLASCASLAGIHKKEKIGFMTHNMHPDITEDMISELKRILKLRYTTKLEDFTLYISGGNQKLFQEEKSIGAQNIRAIEQEVKKIHKTTQHIHTLKDTYNILILDILSEGENTIRTFPITQEGAIYDEKWITAMRKGKTSQLTI